MTKNINTIASTSVEDYLKAIWIVAKDGSASTNDLAKQLNIAAPSVSAMLIKLQNLGFVNHRRYKGTMLSEQGTKQALQLIRRHRLIETFLLEHLNYSWGEVHDEAEKLEHSVSDAFTERLDAFLGYPTHDPHGDPIPTAMGILPDTPNTPLTKVNVGNTLSVARVMSQADDILSYFSELAILPGQQILVVKKEPGGGLMHLIIEDKKAVLSRDMAKLIRGEVVT